MSEQASLPVLPVAVRPIRESDLEFITDSWLRCDRDSHLDTPHQEYFETQRTVIKRLLGVSKCAVVCDEDDADQIYGYAVWEQHAKGPILHFAYVKDAFRRLGVFRRLWMVFNPNDKVVTLTHRSKHYQALKEKGLPIRQRPYALIVSLMKKEAP